MGLFHFAFQLCDRINFLKYVSDGLFSLQSPKGTVHQQNHLQHAAETLLPVLFLPEKDSLPAGMLTEQDLQFKGSQRTPAEAASNKTGCCVGQQCRETAVIGVTLGFAESFQHVFHHHQKLAEAAEGLFLSVGTVEPAAKDAIRLGINT